MYVICDISIVIKPNNKASSHKPTTLPNLRTRQLQHLEEVTCVLLCCDPFHLWVTTVLKFVYCQQLFF